MHALVVLAKFETVTVEGVENSTVKLTKEWMKEHV
jgi:hypothetical protein